MGVIGQGTSVLLGHYVERPAPGTLYLAPHLPPHHVPREAELAELRGLLMGAERQVAVTALRGIGGVGKTTLAIVLCHDQQMIEAVSRYDLGQVYRQQGEFATALIQFQASLEIERQ